MTIMKHDLVMTRTGWRSTAQAGPGAHELVFTQSRVRTNSDQHLQGFE